jgi:hypothetical protein
MENQISEKEYIEREASRFAENYGHAYEDARSALARSYKYYRDIGEGEETARENALDLLASAHVQAPLVGFSLRCMIDHMLYSIFHRTQTLAMQKKA